MEDIETTLSALIISTRMNLEALERLEKRIQTTPKAGGALTREQKENLIINRKNRMKQ